LAVLPVNKDERYLIRVGGYRQTAGTGRVTLGYVPPDATQLTDYATLARCLTDSCPGDICDPPLHAGPCCAAVDFDGDGDVDLDDHRRLVTLLSGP
jgi:hypothetical protein